MTKRILALVLVLVMTVSMLPLSLVSAEAAAEVKASPKAGTHTDAGHGDDCGLTSGWQEWTDATTLPKEGQYVLTKNVNLSGEIVMTGDLTLCLNGYVIKAPSGKRIIGTKKDADTTLTICDCTAHTDANGVYQAGALTGGVNTASGGGAIFVRRGGTLKVYDGRFTGNMYKSDETAVGGGAVMLQGISSGMISKAFIYGGEFTNNKSVKANGTTPNIAGAICAGSGSELTIEGGLFTGNSGSDGGVIHAGTGTTKISGATFTGNTASGYGSVLHTQTSATLIIGDGTVVTGNTCMSTSTTEGNGAAFTICGSAAKVTVTGKVYMANNTIGGKGIASLNFNKAASDTLYVNELAAGSYIEFSASHKDTVNPAAADVIAVNGAQTTWNSGMVAFMAKDGTLKHIGRDDTGFKFVTGHFHEGVEYLPLTSADQLIAGGAYYLPGDVTLNKAVALTGTTETSICLNSHKLTSTVTSEAAFSTKTNADAAIFNIDDCTAYTDADGVYHAGAIDGIQNKSTGHGGGVFMIRTNGTLNFYGGKLTNNSAVVGGGAIFANGTVKMYGGELSGNQAVSGTAKKNGGAIYINYSSTSASNKGNLYAENVIFKDNDSPYGTGGAVHVGGPSEFKNCKFIENNAGSTGGAIHIGNGNTTIDGCQMTGNSANAAGAINLSTSSGQLTIKDTTITGNSAKGGYGAVNVIKGVKPVILKGKVIITDNTHGTVTKNFHIQKTNETDAINATGLTGGSMIGITLENGRTLKTISTAASSNNKDYFVSDNTAYQVELNADNKLELVENTVAPETHKHTLCADTGCTEHTAEVTYEAWTDATKLPTEGNWYLDTDVTVSADTNIKTATTLNLCLNGHTVTGYTANGAHAYSTTQNVATVINISDCAAKTENGVYTAGKFTGFNNTHDNSGGAAIYIRAGGHLNFFDGIIEDCKSGAGGGAIYLHTATANVYNGLFTDNQAIYGTSWKYGGALGLFKATMTIYGGEISGNKASYGGGIYLHDSASVIDIRGGKIINNVATGDSAGVHAAYSTAPLKLSGDPIITGNTKTNGTASNVRLASTGKMVIGELGANAKIGLTASASRALSNAVTGDLTGNFTSDDTALIVAMTANNEVQLKPAFEHVHCQCGKTDCTDTTHRKVEYAEWKDSTALPADGNYCLTTDVTITAEASVTGTLNLCLHGHKVTGTEGKGVRFFSTPGKGGEVINITDCTAKTVDGVYTAGGFYDNDNTHTNSGGGAIYIRKGGTLNFYDGIVSGNKCATGGAAFYGKNATLNFYDGLVTGNKAYNSVEDKWANGGGFYLDGSVLNLYGGTITGNAAGSAAGIGEFNKSTVRLGNVTITGNKAQSYGAGINFASAGSKVIIDGNPVVTGNTLENGKAANVRLAASGMFEIVNMGENAKLGVTATVFRAISNETQDYTANVISDDPMVEVVYQDNVLYTMSNSNHKHCICAMTTAEGCDHNTTLTFAPWDDPENMPTSGNYYLTVDVALSGTQARLENTNLNLCLNGHTVTASESSGRVYYITTGGKLSITDCAGGGKLTGATKGAILSNNSGTDMELNLYAGSITGNHAQSSGGALVLQGGTTFNMYGGKVTENSAASTLKYDANGEVVLDANGNQSATAAHAGGIYAGNGAVLNLYGGEISNNKALHVGYLKAGATTVTNTGGYGGGVYATASTVNVYGVKITGNQGYLGGGLFASGKTGKLNIMGGEISDNTARSGGGVISQTLIVTDMSGGSIKNNHSTDAGGGFYVSTGTTLNMTGGEITGNVSHNGTAYKSGGGIFLLASTANISGGTVSNNKGLNGGAIYLGLSGTRYPTLNISGDALITGNEADSNGGAIFATGEGTKITISGGTLSNNKAKNGGAVITQTKSSMEMTGGKITGNSATSSGGGFYISTNTTFTMTGGSITKNVSKASGGGVTVLRAKATFKGGEISYNTGSEAGALKVSGGTITISGISMVGNRAIGTLNKTTGKYTGGNGGAMVFGRAGYKKDGVQMYDCPVINIYSGNFSYNKANAAAGALLLQSDGTKFNMYGGTFSYNEAPNSNGGAIYFSTKSRPNVYGGLIKGNKAKGAGGIYFLNTTGNISGLTICDNETTSSSAAMIITGKETVIEMKDVEIFDNASGSAAGAFAVQGYGTLNLENAKIYGNTSVSTAGAIYFSNPGYGTFKNVEIYENTAQKEAGGMYVGPASIVNLENVTVRDNEAVGSYGGGIYSRGRLNMVNCKVLNNVTGGEGGGIATWKVSSILTGQDGGVYAEDCVISGNQAASHGGGVFNHRGGPVYLERCTVTDNKAGAEGGAVYSDGRLGLIGLTATGNTSGGEGFAVYLTAAEFDGHSYSTGHKKFGGNMIVKDNQGGEVYLGEGSGVAVVGGPIGEKTYMEVTLHSGVLSEHLFGVYGYEGGDQFYTVTAGDRSITDPEDYTAKPGSETAQQEQKSEKANTSDVLLYVGIGIIALAAIVAIVLVALKKKKAGNPADKATKE